MKTNKQLLSVVVPAYKQEKTIKSDLETIDNTLHGGLPIDYDYEIICVVDGDLDKTRQQAGKVKSSKIKVLGYNENRGKGYAVRFGMQHAKGNLLSFLDAGQDISPKGMMMLMAHMEWYNADIIVGSKHHPVSKVNYPLVRKILSFGYHWLVKIFFGLPLHDTQSGIKIFKRKVIEKILPKLTVQRYAMDIEMLVVAYHFGFKRIYEAPIEVHFEQRTSKIKWPTVFRMAWDTLAVFYRLNIMQSYDKKTTAI
jgi:glycosyltransferase involved in cell wall biosynthesis